MSTPASAVLRAGESVSQGVSGTANDLANIGKSKLQLLDPRTVRVR